jgi:tetratricopeptide (TPR) repeat protein
VGVAAHITAASPGGPRYDAALSGAERSAALNGIWLCQTCSKLIDSDLSRYTADLLRQWKTRAEARVAAMLAAGAGAAGQLVELIIPESADGILSFASSALARVGRDSELAELEAFLGSERPFAWWLWTGPAGAGKSRLAVELCRAVSGPWHAGFLRETDQSGLGSLQPVWPTLVVVDYASARSAWLSDALLRLSQRNCGERVRVLVLERDASGPWWETVQRNHRHEESRLIDAASYAKPRELGGLAREEIRALVKEVTGSAGAVLSSTDVEDIADHAARIDPAGRPLFVVIAALDWLDGNGVGAGRDPVLRRLLKRLDAQMAERLAGSALAPGSARNLRTFATSLGGVSAEEYDRVLQRLEPPPGLLPGAFDDYQAVPLDDLIDGVRPDILGELYVLDRLAEGGAEHHAAVTLLRLGWRANPDAYHAFVERAVADHREHEHVAELLDAGDWHESPAACAQLAADTVPLLGHSDHPVLERIFGRLAELQDACGQGEIDEILVTARYRFANLVLQEEDASRANALYTEILADCNPAWPVHARILDNRGITWNFLKREDAEIADYTAVIEAVTAADEVRACALNNRADIYDRNGDAAAAIADRTAVLDLADTTYDRRYIAHARRASALWRSGDHEAAYQDIDAILSADDIAMEQKMEARLLRARWLISSGSPAQAVPDLETVTASVRNAPGREERARKLLEELRNGDLSS